MGRERQTQGSGAAAKAILARNQSHRYYGRSYQDGAFRYFEHPVRFAREQAYEGKYVIQTEEPNLSPVEAVRAYKELSEVERAFAGLKDLNEMRPIHHRTAKRVFAGRTYQGILDVGQTLTGMRISVSQIDADHTCISV